MKEIRTLRERYVKLFHPVPNHPLNHMTKTECFLWNFVLGNKQMKGYHFQRNCPVLHYTADFLCVPLKLIIEIIDSNAETKRTNEMNTGKYFILKNAGFDFLSFTAHEIKMKTRAVRELIEKRITELEKTIEPSVFAPSVTLETIIKRKRVPDFVRGRGIDEPAGCG